MSDALRLSDLFILESMFYFTMRTMACVLACKYLQNSISSEDASLFRPTILFENRASCILHPASCISFLVLHRLPQNLRHPLINAHALSRRHRGNHTVKLRCYA
jgi:hypothetical protein